MNEDIIYLGHKHFDDHWEVWLFGNEANSMERLKDLFIKFSNGYEATIHLDELDFVQSLTKAVVEIICKPHIEKMSNQNIFSKISQELATINQQLGITVKKIEDRTLFKWVLDTEMCKDIAGLIDGCLLDNDGGWQDLHDQYESKVDVILSYREYSPTQIIQKFNTNQN